MEQDFIWMRKEHSLIVIFSDCSRKKIDLVVERGKFQLRIVPSRDDIPFVRRLGALDMPFEHAEFVMKHWITLHPEYNYFACHSGTFVDFVADQVIHPRLFNWSAGVVAALKDFGEVASFPVTDGNYSSSDIESCCLIL